MKTQAFIELLDLKLITEIGSYGPEDIEPEVHLLNLVLEIDTIQVLISNDQMNYVFDYDPLIKEIDRLFRTLYGVTTLIISIKNSLEKFNLVGLFHQTPLQTRQSLNSALLSLAR